MPTPRFRDLSPEAQASVVGAFLGGDSAAEFTEKLAGQHFTAIVRPDGEVEYSIKTGSRGQGGYFPGVESALENFHPKVKKTVAYQFEILKKSKRPDYIDYPLKSDVTAVEYSGAMTPEIASVLNRSQTDVLFKTKESIKMNVSGVIEDPAVKKKLSGFMRKASSGKASKDDALAAEALPMDRGDGGKFPSSLGGPRLEGLFGTVSGRGFKIPSKTYSDLQTRQAKFYAVVRSGKAAAAVARFSAAVEDPEADRLVSDVLDYVDHMSSTKVAQGYKVFFAPEEMGDLKSLADEYRKGSLQAGKKLARSFFQRVADRSSWVSSTVAETTQLTHRINGTNDSLVTSGDIVTESQIRALIREIL